ncbi:MAG: aminocarboxymuconate-semialdehyde decarboxylase [Gammaproteobacteria bacterium]|jgi:aminocarboxymuconate-semialdehyde decarboxylase
MIIDTHAHALSQETLDEAQRQARQFPHVEIGQHDGSYRLAFAGHSPTRPVNPKLRNTAARLDWMREARIDLQLAGGWLDAFGYELDPEEGADWSRFLNEHALSTYANVEQIVPLATVPLQDGHLAAQVLREAVAAGMPGAMIGTQPHGGHGNLDDENLDPFWEAAAELGAPIIIHPMFGSPDPRLQDFEMMNAVGRVSDVSTAIARLLFTGHLVRYDGLVVVASTGGGALPYMLGRLERNFKAFPGSVADPVEGFSKLYFDSLVFQTDVLRFLVKKVGAGRIMLGSDYPFPIGDPLPRDVVETAELELGEVDSILGGLAGSLFRL